MELIKTLYSYLREVFSNKYTVLILWLFLTLLATYRRIDTHSINNYLIFKYAYFNALNHLNLYSEYPDHYFDSNHYGPLFSLIMAPFAILPDAVQMYLWQICNTLLLFFAIHQLPLDTFRKNMICLICLQEHYIAIAQFQTNGAIAALIILSWVFIENKKDFWAAFCILLGFYIKLYGIVGLAFFFFSHNKIKFIGSLIFWAIVLFALPMVFFSPSFIITSYQDWYHSLTYKNEINALSMYQDVSVMGMVRRITGDRTIPSLPFIVAGLILFSLPYVQTSRYKEPAFKYGMLASVLIFPVLFSSSSELVTYIIAFAGIGIWFITLPRPINKTNILIFVFAMYFGSFFLTDIFPHYIKANIIKPYALKALPCAIVWINILIQMLFKQEKESSTITKLTLIV